MQDRDGKIFGLAVILVILIVSGAAFFFYQRYQSPLQIGFSAGLSGLRSELGVSGRNGAQLAVEEINRQGGIGGRKLELAVADDKNEPIVAREADRHLAEMGVRVIVGHMVSGVAASTVAYANEQELLLISPTIATEELTGIDDCFIRTIASNTFQGRSLALAALQETGVRTIAVVYDENNESFARPIIKAFKDKTAQNGRQVLHAVPFQGQGDFREIIESLRRDRADGVLLIASALDAGLFCQQCRKQDFKLQVFSPMWTMTNDFLQAAGDDAEGAFFVSQVDLANQTPEYRKFQKLYQERFGEAVTFASVMSYDATMIAAFGIKQAGNHAARQIKEAILQQGVFHGLQGPVSLDAYGDTECYYYIYQVREGAFHKVQKL